MIGAHEVREHLTGDAHQRHGVHIGVGDGRDEVGRAGPGGRDRDAGPARCRREPLGSVTGTLLVTHEDVTQLAGVHQRVVEVHDRPARDAEDIGGAEQLERADHGLRAGQDGRGGAAGGWPRHGGCGF